MAPRAQPVLLRKLCSRSRGSTQELAWGCPPPHCAVRSQQEWLSERKGICKTPAGTSVSSGCVTGCRRELSIAKLLAPKPLLWQQREEAAVGQGSVPVCVGESLPKPTPAARCAPRDGDNTHSFSPGVWCSPRWHREVGVHSFLPGEGFGMWPERADRGKRWHRLAQSRRLETPEASSPPPRRGAWMELSQRVLSSL